MCGQNYWTNASAFSLWLLPAYRLKNRDVLAGVLLSPSVLSRSLAFQMTLKQISRPIAIAVTSLVKLDCILMW